jgi:hypothetical protein
MNQVMTEVHVSALAPPLPRERTGGPNRPDVHRYDRIEYRLYTVILFPFAVLAVLAKRAARKGQPRTTLKRHFLSEVIELNRTTVPWVFMGR